MWVLNTPILSTLIILVQPLWNATVLTKIIFGVWYVPNAFLYFLITFSFFWIYFISYTFKLNSYTLKTHLHTFKTHSFVFRTDLYTFKLLNYVLQIYSDALKKTFFLLSLPATLICILSNAFVTPVLFPFKLHYIRPKCICILSIHIYVLSSYICILSNLDTHITFHYFQ